MTRGASEPPEEESSPIGPAAAPFELPGPLLEPEPPITVASPSLELGLAPGELELVVGEAVGSGVAIGAGVGLGVGAGLGLGVGVGVGLGVGVGFGVGLGLGVGFGVGLGLGVGFGVGLGVGGGSVVTLIGGGAPTSAGMILCCFVPATTCPPVKE